MSPTIDSDAQHTFHRISSGMLEMHIGPLLCGPNDLDLEVGATDVTITGELDLEVS